jgi:hypothetical protein
MADPSFDLAEKLTQRLTSHRTNLTQTQHHLHTCTTQLSNLLKSTPKKPRDSKSTLNSRIASLEKDRTTRSLSLSAEKALLRDIASAEKSLRQHTAHEHHQELIWRKRQEVESANESIRSILGSILEIEKVLNTVQLAKRLNCPTAELITREVNCSVEKMNGLLMDVSDLLNHAQERGVHITVDKMHGKFTVRGKEEAVLHAISVLEDGIHKVDVEISLSVEETMYFQQSGVWAQVKSKHGGVKLDFLARLHRIIVTGGPSAVEKARESITGLGIVSKNTVLDKNQASIVVGKQGGTIHELSTKHGVVMNVSKDSKEETSSLKIIGPVVNVDEAMEEVTKLLFDNEVLKESFAIDRIMRGELIQNSGASIKEFENAVSNAVNTVIFLSIEKNVNKDDPTILTMKCPRWAMDRAKSLVSKKIREFESNIITVSVSPEIIPSIIGKGGSKIESLQQLGGGAAVEVDKSGKVKIYSRNPENRELVRNAVQQIVDENQIGHVDCEKKSLGFLFGDPGKEVMSQVSEWKCNVQTNEGQSQLIIKGTKENIAKASEVLKEFMAKNYVLEMEIHAEDENLLFMGGEKSLLNTVESKYDVKASFRKESGVLLFRGEKEKTMMAEKEVKEFLYGGKGIAVIKFKVPEDAIGSIVGKGWCSIDYLLRFLLTIMLPQTPKRILDP